MRILNFFLSLILAILVAGPAEARVFDMGRERFASYLLFTGGNSAIQDQPYKLESSAVSTDTKIAQNLSGEFGFVYANKTLTLRFGFELMKPAKTLAVASDAGGGALYSVQSDVSGYYPKLGLEVNFKTMPTWRVFLFGAAGQTSVSVTNTYTAVTIAPSADFTTKYKGSATTWEAGLGSELFAFDTTTLVLMAGYRKMNADKLTYAEAVTEFNGARAAGDPVLMTDGTNRGIDFTGMFLGLGFRWYLM